MGLEGLEHRSIGALSGGQLQRALLGRAVISSPTALILDEPSTYIDKRFEARLYELLAEINKECRSEEHTSELSHANISYAVFCLKKNKTYLSVYVFLRDS